MTEVTNMTEPEPAAERRITGGNWTFRQPPFRDGDIIELCNCTQIVPGTAICPEVANLTILGGNFVNCVPQPTWDVRGGNWAQISFCSHEHPDWVEMGLPACPEECEHVVDETGEFQP